MPQNQLKKGSQKRKEEMKKQLEEAVLLLDEIINEAISVVVWFSAQLLIDRIY